VPGGRRTMRTIILGLSACMSACAATVPVAEMDRASEKGFVNAANKSLATQKAPERRDAPPSAAITVALPYVINLESAVERIRLDQLPALPGLENHLVYNTDQHLQGRIWHRLRLGFFASRADAEEALKKLSAHYPQAWIVKTSESERINAQQQGLVPGTLTSSPSKPGPEAAAAAMPARDTELVEAMGMPTWVMDKETVEAVPPRAMQEPELDGSSDSGGQFRLDNIDTVSVAEKTQNENAQRDDAETEISYGREEDESVFVRSTHRGGDLFTVGTAFTQREEGADLKARAKDNDEQGFWHMNLSSAPGGAGPGFEAEFAQSSFDPQTSEDFGASENRLIKLATHGSWQGYQLGLGYQSVGTEFEKAGKAADKRKKTANHPKTKLQKGRQGTEAWISRQFGNLGVKTVAAMYQDQGEDEGNAPHFTTEKLGASLNYTILSWPQVGLTVDYANGVRSSSEKPAGVQSTEVDVESIASSLYYSDSAWSGTLYVENATGEGKTNIANLRTYWLGGSYFPISTFSVTPSISYVKEEYPEFDVSTDSFATSMTVSYKPSTNSRFNFTGYSEYSTEKNIDWVMDSEYMYNSLGINWDSKKPKSLIKKWSLELFHDQYTDNLYSDNNTGGVGFMLKMRSKTSPLRRITEEVR